MIRRRMCVGGPCDKQIVEVRGLEYRVALPTEQWVSPMLKDIDPFAPVPFRYGIYRPAKIAFGVDGAHTEIEVLAYYGTSSDEARR
jgi:hypothetical protein